MYEQWIENNWTKLVSDGRWLRGQGPNWVPKEAWETRPYRTLITRLSPWNDVVYSSTHRLIYGIISQNPSIYPDLGFIPPLHDTPLFTQENIPWWLGANSHRGALDFDCIAISNALVQEFLNLAPALQHSGIPLLKSERMANEQIPLIIMGGANSLHSTLLWHNEPLVDGIFVGEEPEEIQLLFTLLAEGKRHKKSKKEILEELSTTISGFFEPDLIAHQTKLVVKRHSSEPQVNYYKNFEPFLADPEIAGITALHISEGCPSFCSFCAESYARKPYRETPLPKAIAHAQSLKQNLGLDEIELFSFNFNNYSSIHQIVPTLANSFSKVGLKSQRFDAIASDPRMIQLMRKAGKSSVTCGLEGISDRIRNYLQKGLNTEQLKRALELLLSEPLRELKIFLIATGHENPEDLNEFRAFLKWFDYLYGRTPKRPRVTFSATPLVRFPWTPLEFEDSPTAEQGIRAVKAIKDCIVRQGFDFREAATGFESEVSQILVRAQDPKVLQALRKAQESTGFLYSDGITEEFAVALRTALQEEGLDYLELLKGVPAELKPAQPPLWRKVSPKITAKFLLEIYQASSQALQVPICLGTEQSASDCLACAACTPQERKTLTSQKPATANPLFITHPNYLDLPVAVHLNETCLNWPWRTWYALLLSRILQRYPQWTDLIRGYSPCAWESRLDHEYCVIAGKMLFNLQVHSAYFEEIHQELQKESTQQLLNETLKPWLEIQSNYIASNKIRLQYFGYLNPDNWMRSKGLKYTLTRNTAPEIQPATYRLDFSKDSLRKKIIQSGLWHKQKASNESPALEVLEFEIEDKFDLLEFMKNAVANDTSHFWKKIKVYAQ